MQFKVSVPPPKNPPSKIYYPELATTIAIISSVLLQFSPTVGTPSKVSPAQNKVRTSYFFAPFRIKPLQVQQQ